MFSYDDDEVELALGEVESAWLWPEGRILEARSVLVRGEHVFTEADLGSGQHLKFGPDDVVAAAEGLLAPRVFVEHDWGRPHPHDTDSPCEFSIRVGGWRPMTDEEKSQVASCRSGEYQRRMRAAAAEKRAADLERQAAQARADARRWA